MTSPSNPIVVEHDRFGRLELDPGEVIHFGGLPGFPAADRFALLRHDRDSAFLWLVALDVPDLAFVVTDPAQFFPDYSVAELPALRRSVDAKDQEPLEVYVMATVREGAVTFNLAAPLVVNATRGKGVQIILDGSQHSTQQPLPEMNAPTPPGSGREPAQVESKPHR